MALGWWCRVIECSGLRAARKSQRPGQVEDDEHGSQGGDLHDLVLPVDEWLQQESVGSVHKADAGEEEQRFEEEKVDAIPPNQGGLAQMSGDGRG